jgi:hypothetical protein
MRDVHRLVGAVYGIKRNAKFDFGISTLPYYPDVPARRRTP